MLFHLTYGCLAEDSPLILFFVIGVNHPKFKN
uniref:Uncharacterized protein n=1 Tax=Arundo donax TaxID=35708 RepID=A0A0A9C5P8_ARUDO